MRSSHPKLDRAFVIRRAAMSLAARAMRAQALPGAASTFAADVIAILRSSE
jgi:hypothetical protein